MEAPIPSVRNLLSEVSEAARHSVNLAKDRIAAACRESNSTEEQHPVRLIQTAVSDVFSSEPTRVELVIPERPWPIRCDVSLLHHVIQILAGRARASAPPGTPIRVASANHEFVESTQLSHSKISPGRYVEIAISSQGSDITPNRLDSILDLETAISLNAGLELPIASAVLDYIGGGLSISSGATGGATIHLYVPHSANTVLPTPRMASPFAAAKPRAGKVLVIDDEEKIRVLLRRMLSHLNVEVALAEDGREGIELYKAAMAVNDPFDLVVLDLTIPGGMGGKDAIAELYKIDPHVKGIVSSGYSQDPVMANYQQYYFCAVMSKPYTFAQLKETVAPFLPNLPKKD